MYHRKLEDQTRVQRLWWLEPHQQKFFRKNRKKCNCWSCRNPRRTGMDTGKGSKEQNLSLLHKDEINEFLGEHYA
jgi:hypothetical protein